MRVPILPLSHALLLGLALSAVGCGSESETSTGSAATRAPVAVTTVAVVEQPMPRTLAVTGSLVAEEDALLAAEAAGQVERIVADRGDLVAKGDAIVSLDTSISALQAEEARASVAAAEVQLAQAEADCTRASTLAEAGGLPTADRDRILAQCEQGRRQLEAARARAGLAAENVRRGTIRAPFAGVVSERLVSPGEFVGPGHPVVRLVALDPLRLELSVPERVASGIQVGTTLQFRVTERADRTFDATIDRVSPALRERTRDLVVEARVANPDGLLKPNSFAVAELALAAEPSLTVPPQALVEKGQVMRVYVAVDGVAEERVVDVGTRTDTAVAIRAGLHAGEQVVSPIPEGLSDGSPLVVR